MTFTVDIVISFHLSKVLGADIHHMIVKNIKDVDSRQTPSSMSRFCVINHFQDDPSIQNGFLLQYPGLFDRKGRFYGHG